MPNIRDAQILILATDGFEQRELTVPRDELRKQAPASTSRRRPDPRSGDGTRPIGARWPPPT